MIVDGGWSKRSHKHSYNAKSGVAIIIGKATGIIIGVRNKHCHACARGIAQKDHVCYKNWTASWKLMSFWRGFCRLRRCMGSDTSNSLAMVTVLSIPLSCRTYLDGGHAIEKLECANHACKCYRGTLKQLVQSNPSYKGSGGLTMKIRKKLVSAARCTEITQERSGEWTTTCL